MHPTEIAWAAAGSAAATSLLCAAYGWPALLAAPAVFAAWLHARRAHLPRPHLRLVRAGTDSRLTPGRRRP